MRIAILSDIHGNQVALEAVLEDLSQQPSCDQIVIAGDLCLNGPRPKEVLSIIQSLNCPVLQGNVDTDVVLQSARSDSKKSAIIAWTREQIGPKGISYLANLPLSYKIKNAYGSDGLVVHANPNNQEDALFPDMPLSELDKILKDLDPTIGVLAFGHHHVAYQRQWHQTLLVDAGSCGLPRDNDPRASYALIEWRTNSWHAQHRRIAYDVSKVVEQLQTSGIPYSDKRIRILTEARYEANKKYHHL